MLEVFPLSQTAVDWSFYREFTQKILNRSVFRGLDKKDRKTDGPAAFIVTLGELLAPGATDPDGCLRNPGALLEHLSFSFIVIAPKSFLGSLWECGRQLSILQLDLEMHDSVLFVTTANLSDWRSTLINCQATVAPHDVQLFGTKILGCFDNLGLGKIFDGYRRKHTTSGTVLLLEKPRKA